MVETDRLTKVMQLIRDGATDDEIRQQVRYGLDALRTVRRGVSELESDLGPEF